MTDPIATSIATAVATGATAALTDATRALITKLAHLIRERFRKKPSDQDTLEAATLNPDDREAVGHLAALLEERMREDPHLAQHLQALWRDIAAAGGHDQVTNTVSGQVHGSVIQASDVCGGISINKPPTTTALGQRPEHAAAGLWPVTRTRSLRVGPPRCSDPRPGRRSGDSPT